MTTLLIVLRVDLVVFKNNKLYKDNEYNIYNGGFSLRVC